MIDSGTPCPGLSHLHLIFVISNKGSYPHYWRSPIKLLALAIALPHLRSLAGRASHRVTRRAPCDELR
ncbi:hypothetical protein CBOM_07861 [Ceraceosorus bombacis]|uniref:Uncharacterized protein n=1 Tax=Ceraceosorus bombacis TaxID=401625 RepID=A0A0N7LB45_9BASI|nr:hypothetical protein CBOM_07861 [Ceraceosorus bombacis]